MSIDDNIFNSNSGSIVLIEGPMFSGKTEELVAALFRARNYAGKNVQAFKYAKDLRYSNNEIVTHNGLSFPATPIVSVSDIYPLLIPNVEVIGVDEGQFLDDELIRFSLIQRDKGVVVIVSALIADALGKQFKFRNSEKTMCDLLIHADYIVPKTAFCDCGKETALYSNFKTLPDDVKSGEQVHVGGKEAYNAQGPHCYKIVQNIIKGER
jgi:thymidine kinase